MGESSPPVSPSVDATSSANLPSASTQKLAESATTPHSSNPIPTTPGYNPDPTWSADHQDEDEIVGNDNNDDNNNNNNDDPFGDDADDLCDESDRATTASLTSSITRYRHENGRRYHAYKDGEYWGPNDEQAANHLDIANHLYLLMLKNKLYLAPIGQNPQRVLDVGTGTGIWAIDFAEHCPSAEVIGTDLSPIQPTWVPPNLKFEIDDAQDEWTFRKNSFDFIHVRSLFGCIADWPKFYRQVLLHLKPGAYIEQVEMAPGFKCDDGSLKPDTAYGQWHDLGDECGQKMGKSFMTMYEMKAFIEQAGFEDIVETPFKLPIGPWMPGQANKELGMWARLHVEEGLENWAMAPLTRILGWSKEQVDVYIAYMKRDLKRRDIHGYHEFRVIYARKPLDRVA